MASLSLPPLFYHFQIPLLYLNNIVALAIGPHQRVLQLGVSLPVLIALVSQSFFKEWTGEWGIGYALECLVLNITFIYVDWILLASPDKDGWHRIHLSVDGLGTKEDINSKRSHYVPQGFFARFWWGLRLSTTYRYVGWSCQVKNVPVEVETSYSRLLFVIRKSVRSILFYLFSDACKAYTAGSPHGSWVDIAHLKPGKGFGDRSFPHRFWYAWVHIVLTYASLEQANSAVGALSVMLGLSTPRDCPSAFGDLKNLVTVRQAWSSVWHQQCRRICSAPGTFIVRDALKLRKGTFASKYLQLYIGFAVSAIVHGGASMLMNHSFDDHGSFEFFMSQALLIMIEDHLIGLGKAIGLKDSRLWRLIGGVWTILVIGATSQRWSSRTVSQGMWVHNRTPDYFGLGPKSFP